MPEDASLPAMALLLSLLLVLLPPDQHPMKIRAAPPELFYIYTCMHVFTYSMYIYIACIYI